MQLLACTCGAADKTGECTKLMQWSGMQHGTYSHHERRGDILRAYHMGASRSICMPVASGSNDAARSELDFTPGAFRGEAAGTD